jgi:DNA-3-methyladenine glycosylase
MGAELRSVSFSPYPRDFYDRPVLEVARDLLGAVVIRSTEDGTVTLRLTEVEAYAGEIDPASHAFRGRTARNATMFGPPGHAYVYFTYGMHYCVNLVCSPPGHATAVLLRAGEVIEGLDLARSRRPGISDRDLARGPARLTLTLDLNRADDGLDVCGGSDLTVGPGEAVPDADVRTGPRVGVSQGATEPWRFWIDGERSVSAYRPAVIRKRRARAPGRIEG